MDLSNLDFFRCFNRLRFRLLLGGFACAIIRLIKKIFFNNLSRCQNSFVLHSDQTERLKHNTDWLYKKENCQRPDKKVRPLEEKHLKGRLYI